MKDKKLVIYFAPDMAKAELQKRMLAFMHNLGAADIRVGKTDVFSMSFQTDNVIVRYINSPFHLLGLSPDEIFGDDVDLINSPIVLDRLTKRPYPGTMMDYIIDIEAIARNKQKKECECNDDNTTEIDPDEMVKFAELVLGLELTDIQKDMMKAYCELRKKSGWKPVKICYGKGGKIFVFPVE